MELGNNKTVGLDNNKISRSSQRNCQELPIDVSSDTSSESGNIEQVTLHFNRTLQQLTAVLVMVKAQNLEMQRSISSLRAEMRSRDANSQNVEPQYNNTQNNTQPTGSLSDIAAQKYLLRVPQKTLNIQIRTI